MPSIEIDATIPKILVDIRDAKDNQIAQWEAFVPPVIGDSLVLRRLVREPTKNVVVTNYRIVARVWDGNVIDEAPDMVTLYVEEAENPYER